MKIELDKGKAIIKSKQCVNSMHTADFDLWEGDGKCQCSFGACKVRVDIEYNGHSPYTYILSEKEIGNLPIK